MDTTNLSTRFAALAASLVLAAVSLLASVGPAVTSATFI